MNTTYGSQGAAQNAADRIHADMINPASEAYNADYAKSAALYISSSGKAGTARWAIPYQDLDANGKPVDTKWRVTVDTRAKNALTPAEKAEVPELTAQQTVSL